MKYKSGDPIHQNCTVCDKEFDYEYPGKGRPFGHRCPSCFQIAHTHNPIGSILVAVCKECGEEFSYKAYRGRGPERCENCRPIPVGTRIDATCIDCENTFSYTFKKYFHKRCPRCKKIYKRKRNTKWARNRRGTVKAGSILTETCNLCGEEFTYKVYRRKRNLCDDCYTSTNLVQLEKMVEVENQWNLEKWNLTLDAFDHRCGYCGKTIRKFHRDHFIPKALGGISDIGNIVPSCPNCNFRKHSKHPKDFLSPEKYSNVVKVLRQLVVSYAG